MVSLSSKKNMRIRSWYDWSFFFFFFLKGKVEPNNLCFKWLLMLKKLAMGQILSSIGLSLVSCSLCNVTESFEHLLSDCVYTYKLWSIFLVPLCMELWW